MTRSAAAPSSGAALGPGPDPTRPSRAIVVAGDEETRVLLRGLLKLHHVRVDGEALGVAVALELVRRLRPSLVLSDVELSDGHWTELLDGVRASVPSCRFVLVAPERLRGPLAEDGHAPDVLLVRPFRIRAFAEAVGPAARDDRPAP